MEVGEMDRKETQVEVPWSPGPPIKPVPMKPVPIYMPEERNQMDHLANGAVACAEFSLGQDKIGGSGDGSNVAGYSGKTCEQIVSDAVSSYRKLGFCEQLLAVEAESRNISVTQGNNDGLKNPFVPPLVLDNVLDPQETYIACCSMKSSQDTSYILDNANKEESRQIASMQVNMEEKDPGREERNVTANKLDNNVAPNSKELCDPAMEFAAVSSPVKENHNPDNGSSHDTDLNKTPQQKPRRRKHRPKVIKEGKPKRTRKPATPKQINNIVCSARLALPGPEQKSIVSTTGNSVIDQNPSEIISQLHLPPPESTAQADDIQLTEVSRQLESKSEINICQPIIEEPTTPEPECLQVSQTDIEDAFYEDLCEIPTINLNIEEFTMNLQNYMQEKMELQEAEMSKALVALNPEAASIPCRTATRGSFPLNGTCII